MTTKRWTISFVDNGIPGSTDMPWDEDGAPPLRQAAIHVREHLARTFLVPDMSRRHDEDPTVVQLAMAGVKVVGIEPAVED